MKKIETAEAMLSLLKTRLRDTPLWSVATINHSEELGPGVTLCDAVLKSEAPDKSWSWFFRKFWFKSKQDTHPSPSPFFVSRCECPAWLNLRTENRLAFSEAVPELAKALDGAHVELDVDLSWTWDDQAPRKNGRPAHRTVFRLTIRLHSPTKFKAAPWLKTALANVCASQDPRADEYVFHYEEDKLGTQHCCSVEATRKGFVLGFPARDEADKVIAALYPDCSPKFGKNSSNGNVEVTLTLPQ
jgi:hypothetical protein